MHLCINFDFQYVLGCTKSQGDTETQRAKVNTNTRVIIAIAVMMGKAQSNDYNRSLIIDMVLWIGCFLQFSIGGCYTVLWLLCIALGDKCITEQNQGRELPR